MLSDPPSLSVLRVSERTWLAMSDAEPRLLGFLDLGAAVSAAGRSFVSRRHAAPVGGGMRGQSAPAHAARTDDRQA
jgi:hypothetical protein